MKRATRTAILKLLGKALPDSDRFRSLAYAPMLEAWRRRHSGGQPIFDERTALYDFVNGEIDQDIAIQYLEFGVWKGESINYFATINANPGSRFVGFDTFTGMPQDWVDVFRTVSLQQCDAGGEVPPGADVRVSFVKGLFQETLSDFLDQYDPAGPLVMHIDCDLYPSTMYALTRCDPIIAPGSMVIFDEFYSLMHEFRALEDYCSSYGRSYEVVAATRDHG